MTKQDNIFSSFFGKKTANINDIQSKSVPSWYGGMQSFMHNPANPIWSGRTYEKFSDEAYRRNVVAHRAITMIAKGAASVSIRVREKNPDGTLTNNPQNPLAKLLKCPAPNDSTTRFFEKLYSHRLIAGNAYIQALSPIGEFPKELHILRPDRMSVLAGRGGVPVGYRYKVGEAIKDFAVDSISGASRILHIKEFHPTDDWYGMSPIEAAAYSIDQHNQAAAWNQSLLQNGARPSGALVVKMSDSNAGHLSEEQYWRIKGQIDEQFSGSANAGRPLLLEGGLEWKEMSLSPKDMDFIECKNSAARDIALAFGVPPQLLGISGDNSYSNLAEARLALWEQTIIPMVASTVDSLHNWLVPMFSEDLIIDYDIDSISALSPKRDKIWQRINNAEFLSDEEKRKLVGL